MNIRKNNLKQFSNYGISKNQMTKVYGMWDPNGPVQNYISDTDPISSQGVGNVKTGNENDTKGDVIIP